MTRAERDKAYASFDYDSEGNLVCTAIVGSCKSCDKKKKAKRSRSKDKKIVPIDAKKTKE